MALEKIAPLLVASGFTNTTPFAGNHLLLLDPDGVVMLTLIARATYRIAPSGLELAEEQTPLHLAAEHWGDPKVSSLRYESEAVFMKPAADVVLLGHAQAGRRVAELDVSLKAGPIEKVVRVFGDRRWKKTLGMVGIGAPQPFERMPLRYEHAFGGVDAQAGEGEAQRFDPRNPVGVGFVKPGSARDVEGELLPNLEDPSELIKSAGDCPPPRGFGFLAPHWTPRQKLAGTYDEAWTLHRFPRLPVDFDLRHNNAAPADQQVRGYLKGGERVEAVGVSERGPLRFEVPRDRLMGKVRLRKRATTEVSMVMDTLIIDADAHQVSVVWRGSLPIHRRAHDLTLAEIGFAPGSGHHA